MRAADALLRWLGTAPTYEGVAVSGWRFEVVEGLGLRVGIRAADVGGPYEGPAASERVAGTLALHWSDGLLSRVTLDRAALENPADQGAAWRADAVAERDGSLPPLATPVPLPDVQTVDPAVQAAVTSDPAQVFAMLGRVQQVARAGGVRRLDAALRASTGRRLVLNSCGFRAAWEETTFSLELWADETAGARYARRSLPTDWEVEELAAETAHLAGQMRQSAAMPPGARGVLFAPEVVEELLSRLVLPNLGGRAVRDGRSPFTPADFSERRRVLRDDLDIVVDTTLPFEMATAPCSPEGIPAGRVALIAGGRLLSPVLDLGLAATFGLPATPVARGRPVALLAGAVERLPIEAALERLGDGVVVRDLPGLHTQAPRRGAYALVAPDAQAVTNGVPGGRCAVRLQGNVLEHLSRPSTCLVAVPGQPSPGLLVLETVSMSPA